MIDDDETIDTCCFIIVIYYYVNIYIKKYISTYTYIRSPDKDIDSEDKKNYYYYYV